MKPRRPGGEGTLNRAVCMSVLLLCACALFDGWRGLPASASVGRVSSSLQGSRTVRVTVTTNKGEAIPDLTPAEFEVKEDGKTRDVLKVEPLAEPLSVAVLLDDRGSDINEIRSALAAFVVRVQGRAEVSLVSVVPTVLKVFDYTSSTPTMMTGIQRLVWRAGPAGGLILSAIADAADELTRREVKRPAIVVVTFEGEEFKSHRPAKTILESIERSRATLHVVAVGRPTMRRMNREAVESGDAQGDDWTVDHANRNAVLGEGPKQSGGRRQELAVASGLTKALEAVADDLLNQYAIVYAGATDTKPSRKLNVSVKRRDVTVRAPTKVVGE
jgi:VWFA-related protein